VVHARALAATGQKSAASSALLLAERDLAAATPGGDEPTRVFFFGEASLAHETGNTLRDIGDLAGAEQQLEHSVATRKASTFKRTHAVTLGYLGDVQARRGELEQAIATWSVALDAMDGVQSARARQTIIEMRSALATYKASSSDADILDQRASTYLAATN
jgi:predicted negative regulator of RcsB-dependent stress response